MNDSTNNGASAPQKQDKNQLSAIKPLSNESLRGRLSELSAFAEVVLNSLIKKKHMTWITKKQRNLALMF